MKRIAFPFFVCVLFVVSCAPATPIAMVTVSLTPSQTPRPTRTLFPSRTPTASLTPFPTFTPSLTSTPQPALIAHEWKPDNVLVYFGAEPGIGIVFPQSPKLILYADGRLFITNEIELADEYRTIRNQILVKSLDPKDVCRILNTIDHIGYLDYDSEGYYLEPSVYNVDDAGSSVINVNAWRTNAGKYYALGVHLCFEGVGERDYRGPLILPALRNTYRLLDNYPVSGFEIYNPNKLLIWVSSLPDFHSESLGKQWPLQSPSLAELHEQTGANVNQPGDDYAILKGRDAQLLFDQLGKTYDWQGELVFENGIAYVVFARPLLPYEKPQLYVSQFPSPDSPKPNFKLICYPSDGIFPVP